MAGMEIRFFALAGSFACAGCGRREGDNAEEEKRGKFLAAAFWAVYRVIKSTSAPHLNKVQRGLQQRLFCAAPSWLPGGDR